MNVYAYITPIVIGLLLLEIIISVRTKNGHYNFQDTITNLGTGIGNQCINLAVVVFVMKWYGFLHEVSPFHIEATWYSLIILLLLQDFIFYWFHRLGHTINVFWAAHMAHHSSEEMNLSVGIRASFTQRLFQFVFFDWVLVLIGYAPGVVYSMAAVHLLLAYWHHTRLIGKMGWIEKFFVTPSHHRVHHGVNPQYLDKNFSEFLIIWDKIFGTFEEEKEPVCYGITHPPRSWNPIFVNFQFWKQLVDDAKATPYWWDKIRIWFMPTGWRPRGVGKTQADERIGYTVEDQQKFQSKPLKNSTPYLIFQLILALAVVSFTVNLGLPLEASDRILLSSGLFLMIIAWGGILESKKWAMPFDIFKSLYLAGVLIYVLHSSGIAPIMSWSTIAICVFTGLSVLYVAFYMRRENYYEKQKEATQTVEAA